jgi:hypothetical protein
MDEVDAFLLLRRWYRTLSAKYGDRSTSGQIRAPTGSAWHHVGENGTEGVHSSAGKAT